MGARIMRVAIMSTILAFVAVALVSELSAAKSDLPDTETILYELAHSGSDTGAPEYEVKRVIWAETGSEMDVHQRKKRAPDVERPLHTSEWVMPESSLENKPIHLVKNKAKDPFRKTFMKSFYRIPKHRSKSTAKKKNKTLFNGKAYKLPKPPVLAKVTKKDVFRKKKKRTRGRKGGKPLQKKGKSKHKVAPARAKVTKKDVFKKKKKKKKKLFKKKKKKKKKKK